MELQKKLHGAKSQFTEFVIRMALIVALVGVTAGQADYWGLEGGTADEPLPILLWSNATRLPLDTSKGTSAMDSYEKCATGRSAAEALLPSFDRAENWPKSVVVFVQDWLRIEDLTASNKRIYKYLRDVFSEDNHHEGYRQFIPQAHDALAVIRAHFKTIQTAVLEIDDYTEPETFTWPTEMFPEAPRKLIIVHLITGSEVFDEIVLRMKDGYMRSFVDAYVKQDPEPLFIFTGKHFRRYGDFYHGPSQLRIRRNIIRQLYAEGAEASVISLDGACVDIVGHNGSVEQRGVHNGPLPAQSRSSTSDRCRDDNSTQIASFNMLTNSSTLRSLLLRFTVTTETNASQWQLANLTATFFSKIGNNKSEGITRLFPNMQIRSSVGEPYNSSGPVEFRAQDGSLSLKFDSLWVIPYDVPGTFGKLPSGPSLFSPGVLMGLITSLFAVAVVIWAMEYLTSIEPMDSLQKKPQNLHIRAGEE